MPSITLRFLSRFREKIKHHRAQQKLPSGEDLLQEKVESVRGIFMHIHKCAGTSIIDAIEKHPEVISCVARPGNFPRRTGRERIPDAIWNSSDKFTFVRNPYARVVSAYRMFMKSATWRSLFPTFKDFIEFLRWANVHEHRVEEETPIKEYIKTVGNIIHHCSSYHNPKYMLNEMNYIGRLETLQEDLRKIAQMLEIDLKVVTHINKSGESYHYREYYSTYTQIIVYQIYKEDIDRFGYSF